MSVINPELVPDVVCSSDMGSPQDHSQRLATIERQLDKGEEKRDKLAERLNGLIADRVVPIEAKVNQIHGTAKWLVPTIIGFTRAHSKHRGRDLL
jgi:hypothetical protein